MTDSLRSEILVPARPDTTRMLVVASVSTAFCAVAAMTAHTKTTTTHVTFVPAPVVVEADTSAMVTVAEPEQPPPPEQVHLVFEANGAAYIKLADIDRDTMPKHAPPKRARKEWVETAVATVAREDMPVELRRWQDRLVTVDNACTTSVTGFAIVSRLTGDTGYAGIEDGAWTARNVFEHGSAVLAARLADCNTGGTYAHETGLQRVVEAEVIEDAELVRRARKAVLESAPARAAQREFAEFDQQQNWWEAEGVELSSKVVRHPTTGVTWVSMHVHLDHGCGGPQANVWGLFRVEPDGTLAASQLRDLDDIWSIEKLIDIDNDGELELIGKPWLGLDTVITRGSGEELDRLPLAFFGCPC